MSPLPAKPELPVPILRRLGDQSSPKRAVKSVHSKALRSSSSPKTMSSSSSPVSSGKAPCFRR